MAELKDLTITPFWKSCENGQGHMGALGSQGSATVQVQPSSALKEQLPLADPTPGASCYSSDSSGKIN